MRDVLLQIAQVLATILLAPLVQGVFVQWRECVERGRGAGIVQPYRDLWKLFHKQQVIPDTASFIFWIAPVAAFTCMMTVPMLIPVLTNYPLPLSDMGDILGGGLILTLGSFMITLAGSDTGGAYGGFGSYRSVAIPILAEPTLILMFVGITLLDNSMLPFTINHLLATNWAVYWGPAHLFLVAAFFILILVETERLPIYSGSQIEVYMIGEARILEHPGPLLGLMKWASMMKQFINTLRTVYSFVYRPWLDTTRSHAGQACFVSRPEFDAEVAPIFGPLLFAPIRRLVWWLSGEPRALQSGDPNFYLGLIGALLIAIPVLTLR